MSIKGEKFVVDFSDDEEEQQSTVGPTRDSSYGLLDNFVRDIVEREPAAAKAPTMPVFKSTTTGFPEHKKRSRISAFKQQRSTLSNAPRPQTTPTLPSRPEPTPGLNPGASFEQSERKRIDNENNQRLSDMSEAEIMRERNELLSSLSPETLQALLTRANLDEARGDTWVKEPENKAASESKMTEADAPEEGEKDTAKALEKESERESVKPPNNIVRETEEEPVEVDASTSTTISDQETPIPQPQGKRHTTSKTVTFVDDDAAPSDPGNLQPATQFTREALDSATSTIHFPSGPSAPSLDPADPNFLTILHEKYFPTLPADPSRLAWMAPIPTHGSPADRDSPYYPGSVALNASELRFDFRGDLLPPRIARALPTNRGLHHHGEAPESAGYTVSELSRLARSSFPAQRCMAFQTLGRFLFKLGNNIFGEEKGEITKGLWGAVGVGKVIETLEEAAAVEGGHQGSKAYATEALWLWQKGGGKIPGQVEVARV